MRFPTAFIRNIPNDCRRTGRRRWAGRRSIPKRLAMRRVCAGSMRGMGSTVKWTSGRRRALRWRWMMPRSRKIRVCARRYGRIFTGRPGRCRPIRGRRKMYRAGFRWRGGRGMDRLNQLLLAKIEISGELFWKVCVAVLRGELPDRVGRWGGGSGDCDAAWGGVGRLSCVSPGGGGRCGSFLPPPGAGNGR